MTSDVKIKGFNSLRSRMYDEAISEYPLARTMDIEAMREHLSPEKGERILGIGEGNGYFCRDILDLIGENGRYSVTDPSRYQLDNLKKRIRDQRLEIVVAGGESIPIRKENYDKIWCFGAFHHCDNQTEAMKRIYSNLREGGSGVICDVFQGSALAKHFDTYVARYSNEGHEVKFLSEEFARSLCYLAGYDDDKVEIKDLPLKWIFDSERDIGRFLYKLHALIHLPGEDEEKYRAIVRNCEETLEVERNSEGKFELNWPLKVLKATK